MLHNSAHGFSGFVLLRLEGANNLACSFVYAHPHLQCFFIDPDMYLAPNPAFGAAMLAGVPLAFTFGLDICAVDKEVQWTFGASI